MFGASVASLGKALLPFTLKDSVDRALKRFPAYPDGLSKQRCWMMLDDAASVAGFDILNMVWSCLVPMSSLFSAFFFLQDGKHVKYSDFYPQQAGSRSNFFENGWESFHRQASIELRLGGRELKSKLLQLEGPEPTCQLGCP